MGLIDGELREGLAIWVEKLVSIQINQKVLNFRKFCTPKSWYVAVSPTTENLVLKI
jgi:hypothetical protein